MNQKEAAKILLDHMNDEGYIDLINIESILKQSIPIDIINACKVLNFSITANGILYDNNKRGVFPIIVDEMFQSRKENKDKQIAAEKEYEKTHNSELKKEISKYKSAQMALKVCLNSLYGATGSEYFVLFDTRVASSITHCGQISIKWIGERTNEYLRGVLKTKKNYVIAQDTDSMYLWLHDLVMAVYGDKTPEINEKVDFLDKISKGPLQDQINKQFQFLKEYTNAYEQKMFMKREAITDRAIWTGKKRYAMSVWDNEGVRYDHAHIKIVGLESVRSTTPIRARKAIESVIELVLAPEQSESNTQKFIADFKKKFVEFPINEIANASSVNGLEKYQHPHEIYKLGTPMHVKAALFFNYHVKKLGLENEYELIKSGNKIKYVPLVLPNPIQAEVIGWENEFPNFLDLQRYIDYNALFDRTFLSAADRILEANKWTSKKKLKLANFGL